ncbi:PcfJ domain-containing protein [Vibrio mediterranei]|uniref:PcfJ domain-containing protein n=1 Tax=Vibrio mediterranei TaxID=689 RepID=UPI004069180F
MPNYRQLLESPETLKKVKTILTREFKFLPEGIIAGGAVCAAVLEALAIEELDIQRFKDLDVFDLDTEGVDKYWRAKCRRSGVKAAYQASFEHVNAKPLAKLYLTIFATEVNEYQHNLVKVSLHNSPFNSKTEAIIESFDLNHSKVALNASQDTLIFSDDFLDFLYQKEVKIVNLETACHTLVRYLEAVKRYGHTPNPQQVSLAADAITLAAKIRDTTVKRVTPKGTPFIPGWLFSHSYVTRWRAHNELKTIGIKMGVSALTIFYYRKPTRTICLYQATSKRELSSGAQVIYDILDREGKNATWLYSSMINALLEPRVLKLLNPADSVQHSMFKIDFALNRQNINVKSLHPITQNKLMAQLGSHTCVFMERYVLCAKDAKELAARIETTQWLESNVRHVLGRLEASYFAGRNNGADFYLEYLKLNFGRPQIVKATAIKASKYLEISEYLKRFENRHDAQVNAINNANKHMVITEINNALDLRKLGEAQRHCVGGYFDIIESGRGSIFKLTDTSNVTSTLFLEKRRDGFYVNAEHRTYRNDPPSIGHRESAKQLLHKLNETHLF